MSEELPDYSECVSKISTLTRACYQCAAAEIWDEAVSLAKLVNEESFALLSALNRATKNKQGG